MLVWISLFVVTFLFGIFDIFTYGKISNRNIDFGFKTIISVIIYALVSTLAIIVLGNNYKMLLTILFAIVLLKVLFNDNLSKIIVGFALIIIFIALSEASSYIFIIFIPNLDISYFGNTALGILIINLYTIICCMFIFKIKIINNFCIKVFEWCAFTKRIKIICMFFLTVIILAYFLYEAFTSNLSIGYTLFTLVFMIGIVTFIIGFFYERAINNKLKFKYDELYNYAKTYETELAEKSKAQHEYRNQLIIVKNLIDSDTKEASLYIEKILKKDLNSKNLYWLNKLINIPYGGLKGLLYYKIMEMVNKKFEIYINISEELRKKTLWKIYEDNAQDITRIIGVYIDNAIEAASISEDKFFILDVLYENNNIEFVFSNTYTNNIDINKIDKEGYSSKGKGRGYGLSLVKDILDNNSNLSQEREINGKFYVQKLIIKTK